MQVQNFKKLGFYLFLSCSVSAFCSSATLAASSGIASNWTNECSIWLCLPGSFPGGCEAAHAAYIKRLTEKFGGKHPKRKWTSLPAFSECDDDGQTKGIQDLNGNYYPATHMTYQEREDAHIPTHEECTLIVPLYKREYDSDGGWHEVLTGYRCDAWKTVEENYVENRQCEFPKSIWNENSSTYDNDDTESYSYYGRLIRDSKFTYDINGKPISSHASPEWCDHTVTSTIVYGDNQQYGEIWRQQHD